VFHRVASLIRFCSSCTERERERKKAFSSFFSLSQSIGCRDVDVDDYRMMWGSSSNENSFDRLSVGARTKGKIEEEEENIR